MASRSILRRREVLLGLGSASFLAAPVFRETLAEAQASPFPVRFVPIYLPGSASVGNFSFSGVLSSMAPFQADSIFLPFDNQASIKFNSQLFHENEARTLLTGDSSYMPPDNGVAIWAKSDSIDQTIAAQISSHLKFTSLQFGILAETGGETLEQSRLSFIQGVPQPPTDSPTEMFTRLFGNGAPMPSASTSGTPPSAPVSALGVDGKSMLDRLKAEVAALQVVAGVGEQAKLDQHLTSLRELEKQVVGLPTIGMGGGGGVVSPGAGCAAPTLTPVVSKGAEADIPQVAAQQFELLYQALTCDLTRVAYMQILTSANSLPQYGWLGVNKIHHEIEHAQGTPAGNADLDKVQSFFAGEVAKFLSRLKSTPEGSGTMLDNTLVFFFTDFWDSANHIETNIPFFTFGRAGGKVTPGRTIAGNGSPHNLLLRGILNAFGIDQPRVGDDVGGSAVSLA